MRDKITKAKTKGILLITEEKIGRIAALWFGAFVVSATLGFVFAIELLNVTDLGFYALLIGFLPPIITLITGIVHVTRLINRASTPGDNDDPDDDPEKEKIPEIKDNPPESNVVPLFSPKKDKKAA